MFKLCAKKNHSHIKHNEQINNQNIDNSKCFGIKFAKIYPEMTSQYKVNFYLLCLNHVKIKTTQINIMSK
jgi:hypothetical protein